jgi:hypothetical protein
VDLGQLSKLGTVIVTDLDLPVQAAEAVIILITLIPMELLLLMKGPKGIRHGCLTARIRSWKPLAVAVALLPYHSMPIVMAPQQPGQKHHSIWSITAAYSHCAYGLDA